MLVVETYSDDETPVLGENDTGKYSEGICDKSDMKILAVIPARAGSEGIPNKNVRIVGSHPLIYYSIRNALTSKYITDVIVTTDSDEVSIIAKQMGVICHWRDASLCGAAVTLDAVVADAVPADINWDYVVTMQPTSPALSVISLDNALKYAVRNQLDTLISVVNAPHLSWIEKDGKKVPDYKERLNRQFLPPRYVETGAFMISRADIIDGKTRIGEHVDVYELPADEAQDIDTFADLINVTYYMTRKKVAFYVNGNNRRGMGHIYRVLEMADEFYVKPDVFYDINQTDPEIFGRTTHNLIPVDGVQELFDYCKAEQYDLFINDILSTSLDYMISLRSILPKSKIVNFEDDGEGMLKADIVFNALYQNDDLPHVYAGKKYYFTSKKFLYYKPIKIKDKVERIFISFGGADPQNYTDRILEIIAKPIYNRFYFVVVLGRAKYNVEELLKYNAFDNIDVFFDIYNMPEIMTSCDIGITSRGRTAYELALLGIPSIAMSQNSREEKHGFVCCENGFTYIGLNPADEIIEANLKMYLGLSKRIRQHFQERLISHNLRDGRRRVMGLISSL